MTAFVSYTDEEWTEVLSHFRRDLAATQTPVVPGEWTPAQHAASLAGDFDPDVVRRRRAEAAGVSIHATFLTTPDLPRSSRA